MFGMPNFIYKWQKSFGIRYVYQMFYSSSSSCWIFFLDCSCSVRLNLTTWHIWILWIKWTNQYHFKQKHTLTFTKVKSFNMQRLPESEGEQIYNVWISNSNEFYDENRWCFFLGKTTMNDIICLMSWLQYNWKQSNKISSNNGANNNYWTCTVNRETIYRK